MARNHSDNIQKPRVNYGEHRQEYLAKLNQTLEDARSIYSRGESVEEHLKLILRVYTHLQNFCIFTNYMALDQYNYFCKYMPHFIKGLQEYISDSEKLLLVYKGVKLIISMCNSLEGVEHKYWYSEFLDDLMVVAGLRIGDYNFLENGYYTYTTGV